MIAFSPSAEAIPDMEVSVHKRRYESDRSPFATLEQVRSSEVRNFVKRTFLRKMAEFGPLKKPVFEKMFDCVIRAWNHERSNNPSNNFRLVELRKMPWHGFDATLENLEELYGNYLSQAWEDALKFRETLPRRKRAQKGKKEEPAPPRTKEFVPLKQSGKTTEWADALSNQEIELYRSLIRSQFHEQVSGKLRASIPVLELVYPVSVSTTICMTKGQIDRIFEAGDIFVSYSRKAGTDIFTVSMARTWINEKLTALVSALREEDGFNKICKQVEIDAAGEAYFETAIELPKVVWGLSMNPSY